eukprot:1154449-Pelagomonas_calceolata.AAC.1
MQQVAVMHPHKCHNFRQPHHEELQTLNSAQQEASMTFTFSLLSPHLPAGQKRLGDTDNMLRVAQACASVQAELQTRSLMAMQQGAYAREQCSHAARGPSLC